MRPNEQKFAVRKTDSQASVRMSFDEDSVAFLMDALTNLYSDPVTAPIREIISNAIDSHVEAGIDRPVEVTRPTTARPMFEVRDFGVGMNVDTALKVYGKYGYSTKRHTNEQIGMMGLGSKAALTYTDGFNVIAVKDGIRLFAVVSRGTDGGGGVEVKDTSRVDEPNGVIVQVPVSDVGFFNDRLTNFVKYAQPGTILVDGEEASVIADAKMRITDRIFMFATGWGDADRDTVVSGGVPYDAGKSLSQNLPYGHRVVAHVDIGDVDMPPNRESLHYTDKTNAALERIREVIKREVKTAAQVAVDAAKDHTEAVEVAQRWNAFASVLTYRGPKVPVSRWGYGADSHFEFLLNSYRNAVNETTSVSFRKRKELLIVTNFPNQTLPGANRAKVRTYLEQNGLDDIMEVRLVRGNDLAAPWCEGYQRVDWSEIKAIKLPRKARVTASNGNVRVYTANGWDNVAYEEVSGDEIILVTPPETKPPHSRSSLVLDMALLMKFLPGKTVVVLEKNRHEKFKRHYPDVVFTELRQELRKIAKDFYASLTDDEYFHIFQSNHGSQLQHLDEDGILDPDVAAEIRRAKLDVSSKMSDWESIRRLFRSQDSYPAHQERNLDTSTVLDDYPLACYTDRNNAKHVEQYINAIYKERK